MNAGYNLAGILDRSIYSRKSEENATFLRAVPKGMMLLSGQVAVWRSNAEEAQNE